MQKLLTIQNSIDYLKEYINNKDRVYTEDTNTTVSLQPGKPKYIHAVKTGSEYTTYTVNIEKPAKIGDTYALIIEEAYNMSSVIFNTPTGVKIDVSGLDISNFYSQTAVDIIIVAVTNNTGGEKLLKAYGQTAMMPI